MAILAKITQRVFISIFLLVITIITHIICIKGMIFYRQLHLTPSLESSYNMSHI